MSDKKPTPTIEQRGYSMPKPAVAPANNHPQPGAGRTMPKPTTNTAPSKPPKK